MVLRRIVFCLSLLLTFGAYATEKVELSKNYTFENSVLSNQDSLADTLLPVDSDDNKSCLVTEPFQLRFNATYTRPLSPDILLVNSNRLGWQHIRAPPVA